MKFLVFFKNFIVEISKLKPIPFDFRFQKIRVLLFLAPLVQRNKPTGWSPRRGDPRSADLGQELKTKWAQDYDFNR